MTWTNDDTVGHTVTPTDEAQWGTEGSDPAPSGWLKKGETWRFTFTEPGTYKYSCIPHASKGGDGDYRGMVGTVVVQGEGPSSHPDPDRSLAPPFTGTTTVVASPLAPARTPARARAIPTPAPIDKAGTPPEAGNDRTGEGWAAPQETTADPWTKARPKVTARKPGDRTRSAL